MAIPQDFVDDLLEKIDIVDVIEEFVPLKKGGIIWPAVLFIKKKRRLLRCRLPSSFFIVLVAANTARRLVL